MPPVDKHIESCRLRFGLETREVHEFIDQLLPSHTLNFNHRSNHKVKFLRKLVEKFKNSFTEKELKGILSDHLALDWQEIHGPSPGRMHGSYVGKRRKEDYYSTPENAVKALLEREEFLGKGWEPASGKGNIAKMFTDIMASDIRTDSAVFGEKGIDFLKEYRQVDFIITNPPFTLALEFTRHALECAKKVAIFARLQFLESKSRYELFKENPPTKVYVFVNRISCEDEEGNPLGSLMPFAWFIWNKGFSGSPQIEWITKGKE